MNLPEPLQAFDSAAAPLSSLLAEIDASVERYRRQRDAGRILPAVQEAIRIELTYHSNAIEGNTLTLRETQLVIEGQTPPGQKPMRELYEARNHDRALRMIDRWARDNPRDSITEHHMLQTHAIVLADIDSAGAGRFRSDRV